MKLKTRFKGAATEVANDFFSEGRKEKSIEEIATHIWVAACSRQFTPAYRATRDILDALDKRGLGDWYDIAYKRAMARG